MKKAITDQRLDANQNVAQDAVYQLVVEPPAKRITWLDRILWLEPIWLAVLAPSLILRDLFWEPVLHPWLIVALFLFWPLRLLAKGRLTPPTPINLPVLLLLLWSPAGLWMSVNWERSWHAIGLLALGAASYFALLNWPPAQRRPWLVLVAITVVGLLLALIGPAILLEIPTEFMQFDAEVVQSKPADLFGSGETVNPNVLAGVLLLPIPLLVALGLRRGWAHYRWLPPLLLAPALYIGWALLVSQSRGSYVALMVALFVVFALRWPWSSLAFGVALLATTVAIMLDGSIFLLDAVGSDGSSGRFEIWGKSLLALRDFWPTGIGIGTFNLVIPVLYPYANHLYNGTEHAHNLLLQVGVDLGLPGLVLFIWLLVAVIRVLIGVIRNDGALTDPFSSLPFERQPQPHARHGQRRSAHRQAALRWALAVGTLGAMVGMLVHGLVDAVTWGTKLAFLPWLCYALTALLWHQEHGEKVNQ